MDFYIFAQIAAAGLVLYMVVGRLRRVGRRHGRQVSTHMRNGIVWLAIFVGVTFGIASLKGAGNLPFAKQASVGEGRIELVRQPDGHYHLTAKINGKPVDFIVDTGATHVVLTLDDARKVGFDPAQTPFIHSANTANGVVRTAPIILDRFEVENVVDKNVRAAINEGRMKKSLLGMSYLNRYEITISGGRLILER